MGGSTWRWGVDMEEKDDALVVKAEAPGFEANDFDVQVEDHRLVLRATRKSETKDKKGTMVQQQEFYQSMTLPTDIDKDKVDATYHNGVLTVTMPKTAVCEGQENRGSGKVTLGDSEPGCLRARSFLPRISPDVCVSVLFVGS